MTKKRGAPPGNQNRRKHPLGAVIKTALYLTPHDIVVLDCELAHQGKAATDALRRELARDLLTWALRDLSDRQDEPIIL